MNKATITYKLNAVIIVILFVFTMLLGIIDVFDIVPTFKKAR